MLDSMFFLPCICIIICVIIVCFTFIKYKRHQNKAEDNIENSIEVSDPYYPDDFIFLGNYYISIDSIESFYLNRNEHYVNIQTSDRVYTNIFDTDEEYDNYVNYLNTVTDIFETTKYYYCHDNQTHNIRKRR